MLGIILVPVTFLLLAIFWWYYEFFKQNKYLCKYKGPRPLPLFGNALILSAIKDAIQNALKIRDQFGKNALIWLGIHPRILICDAKLAEFVLGSQVLLEKSYEYKLLYPWLGTGLLTSSGLKWKKHRKLLTAAFHFQILEQYLGIFDSQSNTLIEQLSKEVGNGAFDVFPYITLCTLDIICEAAMGTQVNAQINSESEYVRSIKEICRIIWERVFSPIKITDALFVFTKDYWKQRRALQVLHGYTNSVIIKRRQKLLKNCIHDKQSDDYDTGTKRKMAFLDILLQSSIDGKPLSNKDIREEVDTFMFEGHDTTSSGISFTLYNLSKHSEIQVRVIDELHRIFGNDKAKPPSYQDLQEMKYLEMVIKESLRMYPPVPVFSRTVTEDIIFDGNVLPRNLSLTIFTLGLHSQPELFPNPKVFDPERFSLENSAGRSPYSYVPFSAGPRNCIGQRFAMLEMKSTISKVLRHFEILPVADHEPILCPDVILKSASGLHVGLKPREF